MSVASNALCSFSEIIAYKDNYKSVQESDTLIENLINRKTQEFHTYCGVTQFKSQQATEFYDGNGDKCLFVHRRPILSVSLIAVDSDWSFAVDTVLDTDTYKIVDKRYIILKDTVFTSGIQNVKITYTAGYETIPGDIKQACIKEVIREFDRRYDFDVSAKTVGDGDVTYVEKGLLKQTMQVLNKYRTVGVY